LVFGVIAQQIHVGRVQHFIRFICADAESGQIISEKSAITASLSRIRFESGTSVKPGQWVIGSFAASDNTCPDCQAGYQSSCVNREWMLPAQAHWQAHRQQKRQQRCSKGTLANND
jgi:hypothetical protein